jgi:CMP-N-acetylneuraminic acid synthetase
MHVVALICARGGSKGLPGKNIRPLAGRPLIAWSIAQARAVPRITRVVVSTDSEQIAAVARAAGAHVPFMRPAELAGDDSPEWLSWRHALEQLRHSAEGYPDVLIGVPATAPLRSPADLDTCLDEFAKGDADMVITVTDAHCNPYFSMVKRKVDGTVGLLMSPEGSVFRRQDAPAVYDITPVAYVTSPDYVMTRNGLFEGRTRAVHVPPERAVDIDTLLDFTVAESLLAKPQPGAPARALP